MFCSTCVDGREPVHSFASFKRWTVGEAPCRRDSYDSLLCSFVNPPHQPKSVVMGLTGIDVPMAEVV